MPRTRGEVAELALALAGVRVPDRPMIRGHACPLDYLTHACVVGDEPRDCVVWANRGGGKTFYAALATMLDLVLKPGIEIMLLGGSLEQAGRMHAHLRSFFEREALLPFVKGRVTEKRIALENGSRATIAAASPTAIRGSRPTILRCDEAELLDRDLWTAAQLTPRSLRLENGVLVPAAIEALSTHHRAGGLMHDLIASARGDDPPRRLFRWGVLDVLERCADEHDCESCVLHEECRGRAKKPREGHVHIRDAVRSKKRVDIRTWRSEMLSQRPSRSDAVYPEFDAATHVAPFEVDTSDGGIAWYMGVDFGFRAPTAMLWGCVGADNVLRIVDERVEAEVTIARHCEAVRRSPWPLPSWMGVDPAGNQRSDQTGLSPITVLRRSGFAVRSRRTRLEDGLRAVRARLAPAVGGPTLLVHERCEQLIEAMRTYRFAESEGEAPAPAKDGPDHVADALRYLIVNLDASTPSKARAYW